MDNSKSAPLTNSETKAPAIVPFDGVSTVKPYRVDPFGNLDKLPANDMTPEQLERRKGQIRGGAELMREFPVFPASRSVHDKAGLPACLFMVAVVAFCWYRYVYTNPDEAFVKTVTRHGLLPGTGEFLLTVISIIFAAFASTVLTFLFFVGYVKVPTVTIWFSLLLFPSLIMMAGVSLILVEAVHPNDHNIVMVLKFAGTLFALTGLAMVLKVICWKKHVPLTVKVLETVSKISVSKQGMFVISFVAGIIRICWHMACIATLGGLYGSGNSVLYVMVLVFWILGSQVLTNTCEVAVCGVFGRQYHGIDGDEALRQGLAVSLIHSFGSIVSGSLIAALVCVVENLVGQIEGKGEQADNCVQMAIGAVIRQLIQCVGDIVEFFNEWAFVQVAIRDVSFAEAVRITWGLCTCANVQFIITGLLTNLVLFCSALCTSVISGFFAPIAIIYLFEPQDRLLDFEFVFIFSCFAGFVISGAILSIINSGAKTILVSWAENPEPLKRQNQDLHDDLESRIMSSM